MGREPTQPLEEGDWSRVLSVVDGLCINSKSLVSFALHSMAWHGVEFYRRVSCSEAIYHC